MKVLVTGGAGFIGSHLIRLLKKENISYAVLDNLSTGRYENLLEDTYFFKGDILQFDLDTLFHREKFDALVHLAGQTQVNISLEKPLFDARENIFATLRLLDVAKKYGVQRIVFASSAAVYGDAEEKFLPLKENTPLETLSFYGLSKLTVENYLHMYQRIFNLSYVVLRFANVYGERQGDGGEGGVISIFAKKIAQHQNITVFGSGTQTRDFIYAGDIATGIIKALLIPAKDANTSYNLSTQKETSVNEVVDLFSHITKEKIVPHYQEKRVGDIYRSFLANEKAKTHLLWTPKTSLLEGLEKTYAYFAQDK